MWHVIHTAPNGERQVSRHLGLLGLEAYAPQFPVPLRTRAGSVRDRKARLVFPRYVFFRPVSNFGGWERLRWAPGVNRLLAEGGAPAVVADNVIDHLRRRLVERELTPGRRWRTGQKVSIVRGPLSMVDAIFDRQLGAPERVRILVTLLGRQVPVEVDQAILSAIG